MKKIYSLLGAFVVSISAYAQTNALYNFNAETKLHPTTFKTTPATIKNKTTNVSGGVVSMRVDPMYNLYTTNSGVFNTSIKSFFSELNCDSIVKLGTSFVNTHMAGIIFDPQSLSQGETAFTPLFTKTDAYTIDTLWFGGIYNRVTASSIVDTLIVDVAWGDTSLTTVFSKYAFPSTHPYGKFGSLITPKFAVATPTAHGLQARLSAPATNYMRYKVALNVADTDVVNNQTGYMGYKLPTALSIPGGSRVAIVYTYKPGIAYSFGTVYFSDGTAPATINGWAPTIYSEFPQPASAAATGDYFNDVTTGKNIGIAMYSNQRYGIIGTGYVQTSALYNQFSSGYRIDISLHGNSSVGIKEIENKGFALGQNTPNPFNGESKVAYMLDKEAHTATFTVTDVMGRVISTQTVDATKGTHTVNLNAQAAGVYYYSLNVDGVVTTKKMIAQ